MSYMQNADSPIGKAFVTMSLMMSSVLMSSKVTSTQETGSCNKVIVEDISTDDMLTDCITQALSTGKSDAQEQCKA